VLGIKKCCFSESGNRWVAKQDCKIAAARRGIWILIMIVLSLAKRIVSEKAAKRQF
jgi:hypothetical protein